MEFLVLFYDNDYTLEKNGISPALIPKWFFIFYGPAHEYVLWLLLGIFHAAAAVVKCEEELFLHR